MNALDELMRRCREEGHTLTYQDLLELHTALSKPPTEDELRAVFESLGQNTWNYDKTARGAYSNPAIARDWRWFKRGALFTTQAKDAHDRDHTGAVGVTSEVQARQTA
jgi:hypothetical protein